MSHINRPSVFTVISIISMCTVIVSCHKSSIPNGATCQTTDQCMQGAFCISKVCAQVSCVSTSDCASTQTCQNGSCVGSTTAITVTDVHGDQADPVAAASENYDLVADIVVTGTGFSSSMQASLVDTNKNSYPLSPTSVTATQFSAAFPSSLASLVSAAGSTGLSLTLLIANADASETVSRDLSVLQGPPGPSGAAGLAGATGPSGPGLVTVKTNLFGGTAGNATLTGSNNTAFGDGAFAADTSGPNNVAYGYATLAVNTTGGDNVAVGYQSLTNNTSGFSNVAVGMFALENNTTASDNCAVGYGTLAANTTGTANSAVGHAVMTANTTGSYNTAYGITALATNTTGSMNTAIGVGALEGSSNTAGSGNVALGYGAGGFLTGGNNNLYLGSNSGPQPASAAESNVVRIGVQTPPNSDATATVATYIAGIYGTTVSGSDVVINSSGQLGVATSSRRYKDNIRDMGDDESKVLMSLRPVTFQYKKEYDAAQSPQYGLVAEEVAQVSKDLVEYTADGQVNGVRYRAINAMLLEEVQRQHRLAEEQSKTMSKQKAQLEAQAAELKAMREQVQEIKALVASDKRRDLR